MPDQPLSDKQNEAIRRIRERQEKMNKSGGITKKKETPGIITEKKEIYPEYSDFSRKKFPYLLLILFFLVGVSLLFLWNHFQKDTEQAIKPLETETILQEDHFIGSQERITDESTKIKPIIQPELPSEITFSGFINAREGNLAILEIHEAVYIVKIGDLVLDNFLVKSIDDEKVIIDINGNEILLILGVKKIL